MNLNAVYKLETCSQRKIDPSKYLDVKSWVPKAIAEEDQKPNSILWKDEPTEDDQIAERLRRIRLCRKHENEFSLLKAIADRLEWCAPKARCCSGACPECGRLLQRWFVRKSKAPIRDEANKPCQQLVAISTIPSDPIVRPRKLHTLSIKNFQRRLRYALDKAEIETVLGEIDFSFNEDWDDRYQPFWSPHFYLITSINNKNRVKRLLKKFFKSDRRIPRPVKISDFTNSPRRRSYAFKITFQRRIGHDATKKNKDGTVRKCRNTSRDKLRASERLELFMYLSQIGLADRFIFRSVKPVSSSSKVTIRKTKLASSYQAERTKCRKIAKKTPVKASFDVSTLYF